VFTGTVSASFCTFWPSALLPGADAPPPPPPPHALSHITAIALSAAARLRFIPAVFSIELFSCSRAPCTHGNGLWKSVASVTVGHLSHWP
jgi:hypothetical protein